MIAFKNFLETFDETSQAVNLVKQKPEFWLELANMANSNTEAVSQLLGIKSDSVSDWSRKIQEANRVVERIKGTEKQKKVIK